MPNIIKLEKAMLDLLAEISESCVANKFEIIKEII